jgi:hypothetical protein
MVRFADFVISRKQYLDAIELEHGKKTLNKLVYAGLVLNAAKKENLVPPTAEVDNRLGEIERRTPQLTTAAHQDPLKMAIAMQDLKTEMALENLRMRNVTASEAEIADYYARNKDAFVLPPQTDTTMVLTTTRIDADSATSMLQQGIQPDAIARQPRMQVLGLNGVQLNLDAMPPATNRAITGTVAKMKLNEVTTVPFSDAFLTIKIIRLKPGGLPRLSQIHAQVERDVKLAKAPARDLELAMLYKDAHPAFDSEKYRKYFADIEDTNLAPPGGDKTSPR